MLSGVWKLVVRLVGQWWRMSCSRKLAAFLPETGSGCELALSLPSSPPPSSKLVRLSHSMRGAGLPPLDWHSRRTWAPSLKVNVGCCLLGSSSPAGSTAGRPLSRISGSFGGA